MSAAPSNRPDQRTEQALPGASSATHPPPRKSMAKPAPRKSVQLSPLSGAGRAGELPTDPTAKRHPSTRRSMLNAAASSHAPKPPSSATNVDSPERRTPHTVGSRRKFEPPSARKSVSPAVRSPTAGLDEQAPRSVGSRRQTDPTSSSSLRVPTSVSGESRPPRSPAGSPAASRRQQGDASSSRRSSRDDGGRPSAAKRYSMLRASRGAAGLAADVEAARLEASLDGMLGDDGAGELGQLLEGAGEGPDDEGLPPEPEPPKVREPSALEAKIRAVLALGRPQRAKQQSIELREAALKLQFFRTHLADGDTVDRVLDSARVVEYAPGEQLVDEFTRPERVRVVLGGRVVVEEDKITSTERVQTDDELAGQELRRGAEPSTHSRRVTTLLPGSAFGLLQLAMLLPTNGYEARAAEPDPERGDEVGGCAVLELSTADVQRFVLPPYERRLEQAVGLLRGAKMFAGWAQRSLCRLAALFERVPLGVNTVVFRQGDEADFCFFVARGSIDILVRSAPPAEEAGTPAAAAETAEPDSDGEAEPDGAASRWTRLRQRARSSLAGAQDVRYGLRHVATLPAGALVGETALLEEGLTRNATVIAMDAELLVLDKADFLQLDESTLHQIKLESNFNAACTRAQEQRTEADVDALVEVTARLPIFGALRGEAHRELCRQLVYMNVAAGVRVSVPPVLRAEERRLAREAAAREAKLGGGGGGGGRGGESGGRGGGRLGVKRAAIAHAAATTAAVNSSPTAIFVVLSGRVAIERHVSVHANGQLGAPMSEDAATLHGWRRVRLAAELGPGGVFGQEAAALGEAIDVVATATEPSRLLALPRDAYSASGAAALHEAALRPVVDALLSVPPLLPRNAARPGGGGAAPNFARELLRIAPHVQLASVSRGATVASSAQTAPPLATVLAHGACVITVDAAAARTAAEEEARRLAAGHDPWIPIAMRGKLRVRETGAAAQRAAALAAEAAARALPGLGGGGTAAGRAPTQLTIGSIGVGFVLSETTLSQLSDLPWALVADTALEVLTLDAAEFAALLPQHGRRAIKASAAHTRAWVGERVRQCLAASSAATAAAPPPRRASPPRALVRDMPGAWRPQSALPRALEPRLGAPHAPTPLPAEAPAADAAARASLVLRSKGASAAGDELRAQAELVDRRPRTAPEGAARAGRGGSGGGGERARAVRPSTALARPRPGTASSAPPTLHAARASSSGGSGGGSAHVGGFTPPPPLPHPPGFIPPTSRSIKSAKRQTGLQRGAMPEIAPFSGGIQLMCLDEISDAAAAMFRRDSDAEGCAKAERADAADAGRPSKRTSRSAAAGGAAGGAHTASDVYVRVEQRQRFGREFMFVSFRHGDA